MYRCGPRLKDKLRGGGPGSTVSISSGSSPPEGVDDTGKEYGLYILHCIYWFEMYNEMMNNRIDLTLILAG